MKQGKTDASQSTVDDGDGLKDSTMRNVAVRETKRGRRERRRKAHHYLMALSYCGLEPGKDYHLKVAGVNSVGQVFNTSITSSLSAVYKTSSHGSI